MTSAAYKRSRSSAMLSEKMKQVIENSSCKKENITSPIELDAARKPPLILQFNILKPKKESLLHHIRVHTQSIVRTFHDQHVKELFHILKYVQTLGLVRAYHLVDIDLLGNAAVKHYLWNIEHNFKAKE